MATVKVHDLRLLSFDELDSYITRLKVHHDACLAKMQDYNVEPFKFEEELRAIEEEICWAEHERSNRQQKVSLPFQDGDYYMGISY